MPNPNLAALVQKLRMPTPIKLFADSLRGNKEPITEKDFTPEELQAMLEVIGSKEGGKSYSDDYNPGLLGLLTAKGMVANSLGRFNHQNTPEGVEITDEYDFNPMYTQENPLVQALQGLGTGGFSVAHALGEKVLPPGQGRSVNIKVPYGR